MSCSGLLAAAFAKPLLVPVLLWLLAWRSRVFLAAVISAAAVSVAALLALGWEAHAAWLRALFGGTRYASPFAGNHGVSALFPDLWLPVALLTAAALVVVLLRRGPVVGLVWAVTSGLLIAPYAGTYAALPIALAIPSIIVLSPGFALAIVAVSPLAVTHPLPIYARRSSSARCSCGSRTSGRDSAGRGSRWRCPGALSRPRPRWVGRSGHRRRSLDSLAMRCARPPLRGSVDAQ